MLVIRFSRTGRRNRAQYRIVVQEKSVAPTGRHVALLGNWDPHIKKGSFQKEEIEKWIEKGAQVSDSVWNLFIKEGILKGEKRAIKIRLKKKEEKESKESQENKSDKNDENKKEETVSESGEQAKEKEIEDKQINETKEASKTEVNKAANNKAENK